MALIRCAVPATVGGQPVWDHEVINQKLAGHNPERRHMFLDERSWALPFWPLAAWQLVPQLKPSAGMALPDGER